MAVVVKEVMREVMGTKPESLSFIWMNDGQCLK